MTPDTIHRIAQDIRNERAALTAEETWLQRQEAGVTKQEGFRYVNWKRKALKAVEQMLAAEQHGNQGQEQYPPQDDPAAAAVSRQAPSTQGARHGDSRSRRELQAR